jgi:hypothetical protein
MSKTFVFGQLKRHKYISLVLALALLVSAAGIPGWGSRAEAAQLTSVSDTLSDSDLGVPSNHTILFTTPNGILASQTVNVAFPAGFDLSSIVFGDVDFGSTTVDFTLGAAPVGAAWGAAVSGQSLILTNGNTAVASGTPLVLKIGNHTTVGGNGTNRIINPSSANSYEITIGGSMPSSGNARVAIIDDVVVTAAVSTTFTFVIAGVATGATVNSSPTTTATTTTATSIPFGVLAPNVSKVLAQDLTVATNARNGFVVTLIQDQNLTSSSGADIDTFKNGSSTATPTAWTTPLNLLGTEDTYGHIGFTSDDSDLNSGEFTSGGGNKWAGNLSTTTPRQIFSHNGPADGTTQDIGKARIGFQAQITALQEAGNDYTNSLTYVATPTF